MTAAQHGQEIQAVFWNVDAEEPASSECGSFESESTNAVDLTDSARDPVGLDENDQRRVLGEDSVAGDQPHGFGHGLSHQHVIKRIVVVPG